MAKKRRKPESEDRPREKRQKPRDSQSDGDPLGKLAKE
jgi:hypothetical protein